MKICVKIYPGGETKNISVRKNTSVSEILEKLSILPGNSIFIVDGKIIPLDAKLSLTGREKIEVHSAFSGG